MVSSTLTSKMKFPTVCVCVWYLLYVGGLTWHVYIHVCIHACGGHGLSLDLFIPQPLHLVLLRENLSMNLDLNDST